MNSFSFLPILKSLTPRSFIEIHLQNCFLPIQRKDTGMDMADTEGLLHQGLLKKNLTQGVIYLGHMAVIRQNG